VAEPVLERAAVGWIPGFVTRSGILVPLDGLEYQQRQFVDQLRHLTRVVGRSKVPFQLSLRSELCTSNLLLRKTPLSLSVCFDLYLPWCITNRVLPAVGLCPPPHSTRRPGRGVRSSCTRSMYVCTSGASELLFQAVLDVANYEGPV
jgi:hypothetical protein